MVSNQEGSIPPSPEIEAALREGESNVGRRDSSRIREEKVKRFRNSAPARTREVLHKLKVLGNCANRSLYEYSDEDVKKIFKAIEAQLKDVKGKFKLLKKSKDVFEL